MDGTGYDPAMFGLDYISLRQGEHMEICYSSSSQTRPGVLTKHSVYMVPVARVYDEEFSCFLLQELSFSANSCFRSRSPRVMDCVEKFYSDAELLSIQGEIRTNSI